MVPVPLFWSLSTMVFMNSPMDAHQRDVNFLMDLGNHGCALVQPSRFLRNARSLPQPTCVLRKMYQATKNSLTILWPNDTLFVILVVSSLMSTNNSLRLKV